MQTIEAVMFCVAANSSPTILDRRNPYCSHADTTEGVIDVEQFASLIGVGAGLAGLIIGYRSGSVAGELAALKPVRQRHNRHEPRRRNDRRADDDE